MKKINLYNDSDVGYQDPEWTGIDQIISKDEVSKNEKLPNSNQIGLSPEELIKNHPRYSILDGSKLD